MKKCFKCGELKEITEFYSHPKMADGHVGKCKECNKKDVSKNYHKNITYYIDYEKARQKTEVRKSKKTIYQRESRRREREKFIANSRTSYAVKTGKLIKRHCEICGSFFKINAHHEDYSKPLNVKWLCWDHHMEIHGKISHI